MSETASICPECGVHQTANPKDTSGMRWALLGCCLPPLGIILYFLWKKDRPLTAKTVLMGVFVCIAMVIFWILLLMFIGMTAGKMM